MYSIEDRSQVITIGGVEHKLILTTKATKDITKRYGGLEKLGDKLLKNATMEESLGEVIWLIALLANQEILIHNLQHRDEPKPLLTEDEIELLTNPYELAEPPEVSFARFVYIGVTQLRKPEEEVLLTPLGELMDQWELHKQFLGIAKPKREVFIEDIIPEGI